MGVRIDGKTSVSDVDHDSLGDLKGGDAAGYFHNTSGINKLLVVGGNSGYVLSTRNSGYLPEWRYLGMANLGDPTRAGSYINGTQDGENFYWAENYPGVSGTVFTSQGSGEMCTWTDPSGFGLSRGTSTSVMTFNMTTDNAYQYLYADDICKGVTLHDTTYITGIGFWMTKISSPTGTLTLYKITSAGKTQLGTLDVSTLGAYAYVDWGFAGFTLNIGEAIIMCFSGGNGSNLVRVYGQTKATIAGYVPASLVLSVATPTTTADLTFSTTIVPHFRIVGVRL